MPTARTTIPTAPLIERCQKFINAHHYRIGHDEQPEGGITVLEDLIGGGFSWKSFRMRTRTNFDLADRIIQKLGGPLAWYSDPVLSAVYWDVPLTPNARELALKRRHIKTRRAVGQLPATSRNEKIIRMVEELDVLEEAAA